MSARIEGAARPSAVGIWVQAIRPATLLAGVTPVLVGAALAASDDALRWGPALAALAGAVLIQIGTNLFNDYSDFVNGADTEARIGPARVTQRGWLTPRQVAGAGILTFVLATLVGLYLLSVGGPVIVAIGVSSLLAGYLYTGGPRPLGYLGLGDVLVMVFFGWVAVGGTYWVCAASLTVEALIAGTAVGALATAILVVNNLRDRHTDVGAGKRTLAVRFGPRFARAEYAVLVALAFVAPTLVALSSGQWGWLLVWGATPLAVRATRGVMTTDGPALNPLLGATARLGFVHGLLLAVGVVL